MVGGGSGGEDEGEEASDDGLGVNTCCIRVPPPLTDALAGSNLAAELGSSVEDKSLGRIVGVLLASGEGGSSSLAVYNH